MNNPEIKYVRHKAIDFEKWDRCVESAANRRVYALSWFLDIVAGEWDAVVAGDYEFVMPLPCRKKFGIRYVYPPVYCQQLGLFPLPPEPVHRAMAACLKKHFRYVSYQINSSDSPEFYKGFSVTRKTNLVLRLDKPYEILSQQFTTHARRNIGVAAKSGIRVTKGLLPTRYLETKKRADTMEADNYSSLEKLLSKASSKKTGEIYAAYSSEKKILAAAFFLFDSTRVYYLNAFSTDEGKKLRAMYSVVNQFIYDHSERELILDFEGSVLSGLDRFYSGFGALHEDYFLVRFNRIPFFDFVKNKLRKNQ